MPRAQGRSKRTERARSLDSLENRHVPERSPSPTDSKENIDIIGYSRVYQRRDADLKTLARNTLNAALEEEAYGQTEDTLVYGNTLGVELIKERDDFRSKVDTLVAEVKGLKEFREEQDILNKELRDQIKELSGACQGYLIIRHRFLDTFRRDILKEILWTPMIQAGNAAAHDGDAVADAGLYETNSRKDKSLMFKVYGLTADQVLSLSRAGDNDSIAILNTRATLKSNKDNPMPDDIEEAWNTFVVTLEENWGQSPKEDPNSRLGRAYYQFWNAYKKYKRVAGANV